MVPGIILIELSGEFLRKMDKAILPSHRMTSVISAKFAKAVTVGMAVRLWGEKNSAGWTVRWLDLNTQEEIAFLSLTFGGPG